MHAVFWPAWLWSRERRKDVTEGSLVCVIGPLLGNVTLFVCVPPAFYRRHGARWKLAGVYMFQFSSLPLENDPPAGYFIPGRSSPLLLCNVMVPIITQRPSAARIIYMSLSPVWGKRFLSCVKHPLVNVNWEVTGRYLKPCLCFCLQYEAHILPSKWNGC